MQIDIRLLEMLASKICHDLISPVGAINNGVELIEDIGGAVVDDAMKLISNSAQQAAKRLRLFRMAYGRAGSEAGVTLRDMRATARDHLKGSKITLEWGDEHPLDKIVDTRGGLKVLLNTVMLAEETLSHGGNILLEPVADGLGGVTLTVTGQHAHISEAALNALSGKATLEEITPRTVHAYVLGRMTEQYSCRINCQQVSEEKLSILLIPQASIEP